MEKQDEIGGDTAKAVARHTPGPWVARHLPTDGAFTVETDREHAGQRWWIADMGNSAHIHPAEREANARLIASAPDLLAVLHHLNAPERRRFLTLETQVMISDAIAKASEQQ